MSQIGSFPQVGVKKKLKPPPRSSSSSFGNRITSPALLRHLHATLMQLRPHAQASEHHILHQERQGSPGQNMGWTSRWKFLWCQLGSHLDVSRYLEVLETMISSLSTDSLFCIAVFMSATLSLPTSSTVELEQARALIPYQHTLPIPLDLTGTHWKSQLPFLLTNNDGKQVVERNTLTKKTSISNDFISFTQDLNSSTATTQPQKRPFVL